MQEISISQKLEAIDKWIFDVEIKEGGTGRKYEVILNKSDYKRLSPQRSRQEFVRASFLFLLDREPKEAILSSFNLMLIARYFPEFESKIKDYL